MKYYKNVRISKKHDSKQKMKIKSIVLKKKHYR